MRSVLVSSLAALVLLGGCSGMVRTVTYEYPPTSAVARNNLQDAATSGPVLLEVRDNPFTGDVARRLAEAASQTSVGIKVQFTAEPARAGKTDFHIVVQFDPAPGVSSAEVCDPSRPVAKASASSELTALVAFCKRAQPIMSLVAAATRPDGANAPVIGTIAEQAMLRMFSSGLQEQSNGSDFWPDL